MPSIYWGRDPQEATDEPFDYEAQVQFSREAGKILSGFTRELQKYSLLFSVDDVSPEKAIWMLQNDALDSLKDILKSLQEKKHRIAGKLFRDVTETLDLAAYFHAKSTKSNNDLSKWYQDGFVSHSDYRNFIKKEVGEAAMESSKNYYILLSKLAHRSYNVLLYGYAVGREKLLSYDGYDNDDFMVLPHTISMYYAILADTILKFIDEIGARGLVQHSTIIEIYEESIEKETVQKRFKSMKEFVDEFRKQQNIGS